MRLFSYYALHSLFNQIRKLLKTWVLIFLLACMVLGGVIGLGAAKLSEVSEEAGEAETETLLPEEVQEAQDAFLAETSRDRGALTELIAGAVILAVLVYEVLSADKNGSRIFLPADVNLLFPSPMQPQSVLMFRLMTKMGTFIVLGIYLLLQLPNLVLNLGMSLWAALALIAAWCLTVMLGSLLQVLTYTFFSTRPGSKVWLRRGVYILLAAVLAGYALYWRGSGLDALGAAAGFFNAPVSRYIPLWGWLKGFFLFAAEGNASGALLCLAGNALLFGVLLWLIRRSRADFYEDAMARSEETAELLERAKSEKSGGIVFAKRKKDRGDGVRRDGLRRGWGAGVFFHKSLYNRFRFAHLGFFTKTMETYLLAGLAVALLCRFVIGTRSILPAALTLSGLCFFRALGNPLEQDTKMDFFRLIPESMWAKLFYSLLGGTVNCLLDVILPMVLAAAILGADALTALAWVAFAVSVDFYATCVGTFIDLSVPVSAGTTVKQIVQVMFVYFGLLPDIAVMAVGIVLGHAAAAGMISAAVNVFLGLLFFALAPLFLESRGSRAAAAGGDEGSLPAARRRFSRLGWAAFAVMAVGSAMQLLTAALLPESWQGEGWYPWLVTFAPLYLIGVPAGWLVLRRMGVYRPAGERMSASRFAAAAVICVFLMYAGNLLGSLVTGLLQSLLGGQGSGNPVLSYLLDDNLTLKILCVVILAPAIEELVFRRMLIDRMRVHGEKLAVITSAAMFALFHGNFSQLFYAFALGALFAYIYLRTGRLRYSIALHMFVNCLGSVVGPAMLERAALDDTFSPENLPAMLTPGRIAFGVYAVVLLALALAGLVLLIVRARSVHFEPAGEELPRRRRFSAAWLNSGMLVFTVFCIALIISALGII